MRIRHGLLAAGAALLMGLGMQSTAEAKTYVSIGVGIGVAPGYYHPAPGYFYWPGYYPVYVAPRHYYRPRRVRVYRKVCSRQVRVVRRWSYRKGRWVTKRIRGPRRCWRVRVR